MRTPRRWMRLLTGAAIASAALVTGGCGSTAPSGPSPVPGPPVQYPSILGGWAEEGSSVVLRYRDTGGTSSWGCDTKLSVVEQTGGTFSGLADVQGGAGESGRHCTYGFSFTAQMAADGTITSFRPNRSFAGHCTPVSEPTASGTANSTAMRIDLTDRATCLDYFGQPRDTDRTLTMSVTRRPASAS